MKPQVEIYDTTLRDGSQGEGINFSVADKLRIAEKLDAFGVHYIEGGWPGSNPKDIEFFAQARHRKFKNARLAAFGSTRKKGVPVVHVEAGLRTYRKDAPFPEEVNRQMTTAMAEWHFAATEWARDNLLLEGVPAEKIAVTGNPVIDALHWTARNLDGHNGSLLPQLDGSRRMVLVTAHRRESFGPPFVNVCNALRDLVERNADIDLVYPVHLNPEVQAPVRKILGGCARVHLLPPVDYWNLVDLLRRCYLVLTDSGGIQEEAPSLGKPVLVLRETTERPEGVEAGTARLVGTERAQIVAETERLLHDGASYKRMAKAHNPYGDGHAGERIAAYLAGSLCPAGSSGIHKTPSPCNTQPI